MVPSPSAVFTRPGVTAFTVTCPLLVESDAGDGVVCATADATDVLLSAPCAVSRLSSSNVNSKVPNLDVPYTPKASCSPGGGSNHPAFSGGGDGLDLESVCDTSGRSLPFISSLDPTLIIRDAGFLLDSRVPEICGPSSSPPVALRAELEDSELEDALFRKSGSSRCVRRNGPRWLTTIACSIPRIVAGFPGMIAVISYRVVRCRWQRKRAVLQRVSVYSIREVLHKEDVERGK